MEKLNLTQQKQHSPIKRNVLQHKINTKTKTRFSRLLWHPAWKRRWPILFRCFINLSLTYLFRHFPLNIRTAPDPHGAINQGHERPGENWQDEYEYRRGAARWWLFHPLTLLHNRHQLTLRHTNPQMPPCSYDSHQQTCHSTVKQLTFNHVNHIH